MITKKLVAGQKFGRLTVIKEAYTKTKIQKVFRKRNNFYTTEKCNLEYYLCKCDCGKEKVVFKGSLTKGLIKSCGCLAKERIIYFNKNIREYNKPFRNTKLYRIWSGIKSRCYNKKDTIKYATYGGRGIKVCDEWKKDFMAFYNWAVNNGYKDGLSIDRIDVNGNYEPNNCRWTTIKEQERNKRKTIYLVRNGEKDSLANWADRLNISYNLLYSRSKKKTKWFKENFS